jgi:RNA polymerase sigma-70 factor (ECF subfamily)
MSAGGSPPFVTTRWTVIATAGGSSSPEARRALTELCTAYWYPLYAYVRRKGMQPAEAQDLTQAFFTELLEKQRLQMADQQRGRFRSFLLASLNHFLANQWRQAHTLKRGGACQQLPLDFTTGEERYVQEPAHEQTPERIFERKWAVTLLDNTLSGLREEYAAAGKTRLFEVLKSHLGGSDERTPYDELARQLEMSAGALKVAAHRLRKRYRELLRQEIAETVASADEIEDELRALFLAVSHD